MPVPCDTNGKQEIYNTVCGREKGKEKNIDIDTFGFEGRIWDVTVSFPDHC